MKGKALTRRVEEILEVPDGSLTRDVRMEWAGDRQVVIEGCCGILQYEEDLIRLDTPSGELRFRGSGLRIGCLNEDGTVITGRLLSMEFMN